MDNGRSIPIYSVKKLKAHSPSINMPIGTTNFFPPHILSSLYERCVHENPRSIVKKIENLITSNDLKVQHIRKRHSNWKFLGPMRAAESEGWI